MEEFEIGVVKADKDVDLSIDEFAEEEEETPLKFEKRKAGKASSDDVEVAVDIECPFCGELIADVAGHINECEFAPEDASIEDILPSKGRKKKKKPSAAAPKTAPGARGGKEKEMCPYCSKEFLRLARHLKACKKRPKESEIEK